MNRWSKRTGKIPMMLSSVRGMFTVEIRSQFRSGLSFLYLGMPLVWIILIKLLPPDVTTITALIGTFADPVMMGQIFTGAFLARERDQGLLEAWAVTPLGAGGWLAARCIVIGIQGSIGAGILIVGAGVQVRWGIFIPAIFLAAATGALTGIILARPFRDIMSYFVAGGTASTILSLPILGGLVRPGRIWMYTGPVWSSWTALSQALEISPERNAGSQTPMYSAPMALFFQVIWILVLFLIARFIYHRGFFRRFGNGSSAGLKSTGAVV